SSSRAPSRISWPGLACSSRSVAPRSSRARRASGGSMQSPRVELAEPLLVLGEQRAEQLVEGLAVAARDDGRRQRAHGGSPRHVHRKRDLAEVVARLQNAPGAQILLADGEDPREDEIEALARVALADDL